MVAYPPNPPGMTAGMVVQRLLAEMNQRRGNPQVGLRGVGHDVVDTDGNP